MKARRFLGVLAAVASIVVAGVPSGAAATGGGISVGAAKRIPHALTLFDLACPPGRPVTHSVCGVALQTDYNPYGISLIRNGTPQPATVVPPNGIAIACPTTTTCVLADRGGIGWVVDGHSTSVTALGGMDVLTAIACTSVTRCVAVGDSGATDHQRAVYVVVTRGTEIANARRVAGATLLDAVSCSGAGRCVAVGQTGQANQTQRAVTVSIANGKPPVVHPSSTLTSLVSVSCGAPASCYAAGDSLQNGAQVPYLLPVVTGKPGTPIRDPAGVTDLSCWNATDCLGVNNQAAARLHRGRVMGTKRIHAPRPVQYVSCPTAAGCLVSGGSYGGKEAVAIVRP